MQAPSQKSRKIKVRVDRHTSSLLTLHLFLTPKFRAKVLMGGVAITCERIIRQTCKNLEVDIIQMAVAEDHVHLFLQYPPRLAPSKISEAIKSNSSRELRAKFPHLVKWCKTALWAPGGFRGSVGRALKWCKSILPGRNRHTSTTEVECSYSSSKCPTGLWKPIKAFDDGAVTFVC